MVVKEPVFSSLQCMVLEDIDSNLISTMDQLYERADSEDYPVNVIVEFLEEARRNIAKALQHSAGTDEED